MYLATQILRVKCEISAESDSRWENRITTVATEMRATC